MLSIYTHRKRLAFPMTEKVLKLDHQVNNNRKGRERWGKEREMGEGERGGERERKKKRARERGEREIYIGRRREKER